MWLKPNPLRPAAVRGLKCRGTAELVVERFDGEFQAGQAFFHFGVVRHFGHVNWRWRRDGRILDEYLGFFCGGE